MDIKARFTIGDDRITQFVRSYPILSEIPHFLRNHKRRMSAIDELVLYPKNPRFSKIHSVNSGTFHSYRTPYAAIDALAPAFAEFFIQNDVLPIIDPFENSLKHGFSEYRPDLWSAWAHHGILIPREAWQ